MGPRGNADRAAAAGRPRGRGRRGCWEAAAGSAALSPPARPRRSHTAPSTACRPPRTARTGPGRVPRPGAAAAPCPLRNPRKGRAVSPAGPAEGRGALFPPLPPDSAGEARTRTCRAPACTSPAAAGGSRGAAARLAAARGARRDWGRSSHAGLSRTARRRLSGLSAPPSIVSAPQPQSISYLSAPVNPPLIYVSFCC
ncbi:uncharacterized protein GJ701_007340 [Geothlypis trichas]